MFYRRTRQVSRLLSTDNHAHAAHVNNSERTAQARNHGGWGWGSCPQICFFAPKKKVPVLLTVWNQNCKLCSKFVGYPIEKGMNYISSRTALGLPATVR